MPRGRRDEPLDVLLVERLAAGDGVEEMPVDADHEVTGQIHPLDGNVRAGADGDPDRRAGDRDPGATLEHGVEIVGARVATACATQAEPVAQERTDQRDVRRGAPLEAAARAQLARELVEALEPALRFDAGAVVGREPERTLGDIAIPGGAFEHRLAWLQSLHGR